MQSDIDLDEQLRTQAAPIESSCEPFGRGDTVDGDGQLDTRGGDLGEPFPLLGAERRIVDEDPLRTRFLEYLCLAGLRNGETVRAELELPTPDLRRLVRFRVRPQLDSVRVDVRLHAPEIHVEAVEVDDGHGRLDIVEGASDLPLEQVERPLGAGGDLGRRGTCRTHRASIIEPTRRVLRAEPRREPRLQRARQALERAPAAARSRPSSPPASSSSVGQANPRRKKRGS